MEQSETPSSHTSESSSTTIATCNPSTMLTMATMPTMAPVTSSHTSQTSIAATSPVPLPTNFTSLPPPAAAHPMASLSSTRPTTSQGQPSPGLPSTFPASSGSLMTSLPSSLSALPPASLSLPPPNFQPVLEPFLQGHHQIQAEKVQAEGDVRERRPSLGALLQQQQPSLLPQQAAGNPQVHQLGGQPQAFNLLQQPNIVQQLSALQQQHPSPAVSTTVDYTPLKVRFFESDHNKLPFPFALVSSPLLYRFMNPLLHELLRLLPLWGELKRVTSIW